MKKKVAALPSARGVKDIATGKKQKNEVPMSRIERWGLTGIIALSECGLMVRKTYLEHEIVAMFCCCYYCCWFVILIYVP